MFVRYRIVVELPVAAVTDCSLTSDLQVMLMGKEVFGDVMLACGHCGYWSQEGSNVRRHLKNSVCLKDRGYSKKELVGLDKVERRRFLRRLASAKCRARKKAKGNHIMLSAVFYHLRFLMIFSNFSFKNPHILLLNLYKIPHTCFQCFLHLILKHYMLLYCHSTWGRGYKEAGRGQCASEN